MSKQKPTFDIDAAIAALREGQDLTGKDGVFTPLIKQLTERPCRQNSTVIWGKNSHPTARMVAPQKLIKALPAISS